MTRWQYFQHLSANMTPSGVRWTYASLACSLLSMLLVAAIYLVDGSSPEKPAWQFLATFVFCLVAAVVNVAILYQRYTRSEA